MPAISELPAASSVTGSEVTPVLQGGVAKKAALTLFTEFSGLRVVPGSAGFEEGWAFADTNGWTTPALRTAPTGLIGSVVLLIVPGADFSGLSGAIQIH